MAEAMAGVDRLDPAGLQAVHGEVELDNTIKDMVYQSAAASTGSSDPVTIPGREPGDAEVPIDLSGPGGILAQSMIIGDIQNQAKALAKVASTIEDVATAVASSVK